MTELICLVAAFANTGREQLTRCENTEKGTLKKQTTCKTRYFGKMLSGAGIKREMPFIDAILASVARMRCET